MMRQANMAARLPHLWGVEPGTVLHALLALVGNELTAFDEDLDRVKRSHWVDTAWSLLDLARIGSLFGIAPAPWEGIELFRARLKAMIAARLRGAVTADALEFAVLRILQGAQAELGDRYMTLDRPIRFGEGLLGRTAESPPERGRFVEFPVRRRRSPALAGPGALRRPLAKLQLDNKGLEPTPLLGAITGVAGRRTAVPVLVNLTTGQVMLWAGLLECGQRLEFSVEGGRLLTRLGDADVSDRLWTGEGFVPGQRFSPVIPDSEPRPLMLARGANTVWFWPLGLYDRPGLDSGVFATPEPDLEQGMWGATPEGAGSRFGRALFEQPAAVSLDLWWEEQVPASFRIELPAGVVRRARAGAGRDTETERAQLFRLLDEAVGELRAAGVDGRVEAAPLRTVQRLASRGRPLPPIATWDVQPLESTLGGISALFDTTATDAGRMG